MGAAVRTRWRNLRYRRWAFYRIVELTTQSGGVHVLHVGMDGERRIHMRLRAHKGTLKGARCAKQSDIGLAAAAAARIVLSYASEIAPKEHGEDMRTGLAAWSQACRDRDRAVKPVRFGNIVIEA